MKSIRPFLIILAAAGLSALPAAEPPEKALADYRAELVACRAAHGGSYDHARLLRG